LKTLELLLREHKKLLRPAAYAQMFTGKKFLGLFRPGVYVMFQKKRILYIGRCGSQLIKRAVLSNSRALDNATALQLLPCKNSKAAVKLESILIAELKPKHNKYLKYVLLQAPIRCS
jgi:hypothetical protein